MGLDTVELVMRIEKQFDITIPDQDAELLETVGKTYLYISRKIQFRQSADCLTAAAFYQLRRAIVAQVGVDRKQVRPSTQLDRWIDRTDRKLAWSGLSAAVGFRLPNLVRPRWLVNAMGIVLLLVFLSVLAGIVAWAWTSAQIFAGPVAVFFAFASTIMAAALLFDLTSPLAIEFAKDCATVGGLSSALLRMHYGSFASVKGAGSPTEVWETLRAIVADQCGVEPETITASTHFVKDLGVG